MQTNLSIAIVFMAGMGSFFTPCILPVIPAYLSLITCLSFEELSENLSVRRARWHLFASALAFVIGFSVVLVLVYGSFASLITELDDSWKIVFRWVGGIIVFIFALHMIGIFRIKLFYQERRFHFSGKGLGLLGATLAGAAFAFGWTPCMGTIISSVFTFAASTANHTTVWWYFIAYNTGLAIPFLMTAIFINLFLHHLQRFTKHLRKVEIFTGILLLGMGILLVTNNLKFITEHSSFLFNFRNK